MHALAALGEALQGQSRTSGQWKRPLRHRAGGHVRGSARRIPRRTGRDRLRRHGHRRPFGRAEGKTCRASSPTRHHACPPGSPAYPWWGRHAGRPGGSRDGHIDMFRLRDATRNARNGHLFTCFGDVKIKNARFRNDTGPPIRPAPGHLHPIHPGLPAPPVPRRRNPRFHAFNTIHNLHYYQTLMAGPRGAIETSRFRAIGGKRSGGTVKVAFHDRFRMPPAS